MWNLILKKGVRFQNSWMKRIVEYTCTPYLLHHSLQSCFQLLSKDIKMSFSREKIFFDDGGHVSLDWLNRDRLGLAQGHPIVLVMHGVTGGSDCKYIRVLGEQAQKRGYSFVCLNSRGINNQMTSPIPFIGLQFHELQQSLKRIKLYDPSSPIHLIGTSLGGNYLLRYLLQKSDNKIDANIKSISIISSPFDVKHVIYNMNILYQKSLIKYYLKSIVCKHPEMSYWWDSGLVNLKKLKQSKNLYQFHERITAKIIGVDNLNDFFDQFTITQEMLAKLNLPTFILFAKDDPVVPFKSLPINILSKNKNVHIMLTQRGGHICWFAGWNPKRWYPKPVFQFIDHTQSQK